MKKRDIYKVICILIIVVFSGSHAQHAGIIKNYPDSGIKLINGRYHFWENLMHQDAVWWQSEPAMQLAENVLAYQRQSGGWPKNIDMLKPLTESEKNDLATYPNEPLATIDNDATWSQMYFLAKLISFQPEERYKLAFLKGLDYLLEAQYENGGWPQYYPQRKGYYTHITYNDKAMIGVMQLLKDISDEMPEFGFIDTQRREKVKLAMNKGINCLLMTQTKVNGELTAWGAQHDEITLEPTGARKYELPSLCSKESAEIIVFLMSLDNPSTDITKAIQSAVKWLEKVKMKDIALLRVKDDKSPTGFDRRIIKKKGAEPLWARFYDVKTFKPIYSDRDGKIYKNLADISYERRNDYGWIGDWPRKILYKKYTKWQKQYAPDMNMLKEK